VPSSQTVRDLLAARYPRSLGAWADRMRCDVAESAGGNIPATVPVLVRLTADVPAGAPSAPAWHAQPGRQAEAETALGVKVLRHLGRDEFVVTLRNGEDQNQLSLEGHLDVTRGGFRLIAL
jgi:hypothetical protein